MATTLSAAKQMLNEYITAEKMVLKNQSYTIKDRTYTRATLSRLQEGRRYWEKRVAVLENGGSMKVRRVIPRDD
jgi:hypothetical protein